MKKENTLINTTETTANLTVKISRIKKILIISKGTDIIIQYQPNESWSQL